MRGDGGCFVSIPDNWRLLHALSVRRLRHARRLPTRLSSCHCTASTLLPPSCTGARCTSQSCLCLRFCPNQPSAAQIAWSRALQCRHPSLPSTHPPGRACASQYINIQGKLACPPQATERKWAQQLRTRPLQSLSPGAAAACCEVLGALLGTKLELWSHTRPQREQEEGGTML